MGRKPRCWIYLERRLHCCFVKIVFIQKTLGFNDKDDGLSCLIKDGQISRQEALERVNKEGEIPKEVIKSIFDKLGLNYSDLKVALKHCEDASFSPR